MDNLASFTDILEDEIPDSQQSQPMSLPSCEFDIQDIEENNVFTINERPAKGTGQHGQFRSVEEIDPKYRGVFTYPFFNMVQSRIIDDALYSDKSLVVCAPTGSGKTVIFEMAIVQLLMEWEDKHYTNDFKIIYLAPVKALCTERLSEWYPKFTKLGLLCIVVTGDTDIDFSQLKPYRIIITTPEKWDMLTRRWRDHRSLVEVIKLFLIDEVHTLNDETRGPTLEVVVSRMKTIEASAQSQYRIEQFQNKCDVGESLTTNSPPRIRFVAVSATVNNPEDVASWLGNSENPAVHYKFGDECRPVKINRVVEGYHCAAGTSIFKFDIILNYKLWPIIQKYHNGKPTLIFCNTRKGVILTAEMLSREITINFSPEQRANLTQLASTIKTKKLQSLIMSGVGCHHAGMLFEERTNIEQAFRNRELPILITTTTLAMGVNLPAHLVIIKNTQQYVNGTYQEYSISTVLQMVGRAGRPQFDTEATAVIMTRLADKARYQALVGGNDPLQSYLHKRLPENLNSEAALGTVTDVAQCVQWVRSTFLWVRAGRDPRRYLGLPASASQQLITKKIHELCMKAMHGLRFTGLITMDEDCCIESTEAGRLMSIYYIDLETMKNIMKIEGKETLERLLNILSESHEFADMHLRIDERRCLNALNRNNQAATIRFPMKGKITTRTMKLNCIIQAILGCLPIPDPSLNQESIKVMRVADRICKCLVAYVTRSELISQQPSYFTAVLNSLILAKCISAQLWENSPFVSRQLTGIGPTYSAHLANAGKVNFMLLEESHPRDLERIMNKGPPAGNVLRRQVCLLPKYSLRATRNDEKSVTIQLFLLNQAYLADNMKHLTAGEAHKCYIVVGDSENNVLLFTSFKDKDLVYIFDGSITYQVTRKHDCEHKIYAHCISSTFVGIDEQCEYIFEDLRPLYCIPLSENTTNQIEHKKQMKLTDNFNERKRKNENSIKEFKEKKKRDSAVIEKFNCLKKESMRATYNELCNSRNYPIKKSDTILHNITQKEKGTPLHTDTVTEYINDAILTDSTFHNINVDDSIDENKINDMLKEIESEISRSCKDVNSDHSNGQVNLNRSVIAKNSASIDKNIFPIKSLLKTASAPCNKNVQHKHKNQKLKNNFKPIYSRTNYSFIDSIEKNNNYNENDEIDISENDLEFSNAIKPGIDNFLMKTRSNLTNCDSDIIKMFAKTTIENNNTQDPIINKNQSTQNEENAENPEKMNPANNVNNHLNAIKIDKGMCNNKNDKMETALCLNQHKQSNEKNNEQDKLSPTKTDPCKDQVKKRASPCGTLIIDDKFKNSDSNQNRFVNLDNIQQNFRQVQDDLKPDFTYGRKVHTPVGFSKNHNDICQEIERFNTHSLNFIEKFNYDTSRNKSKTENDASDYIKKYTYTSTKFDIRTKNENDYKVHVIRKFKLDLDVTEAVVIEDNNNNINEQDDVSRTKATVSTKRELSPVKNILQKNYQIKSTDNNKIYSEILDANGINCYNSVNYRCLNNVHPSLKPIEYANAIQCDSEQNYNSSVTNWNKDLHPNTNHVNNTNTHRSAMKRLRLQNDMEIVDVEGNIEKEQDKEHINQTTNDSVNMDIVEERQILPKKITILNILQKYKNLPQETHSQRDFENRRMDTTNNINKDKQKQGLHPKPFRISEINSIKVSFHNTLIDETPSKSFMSLLNIPAYYKHYYVEKEKNKEDGIIFPDYQSNIQINQDNQSELEIDQHDQSELEIDQDDQSDIKIDQDDLSDFEIDQKEQAFPTTTFHKEISDCIIDPSMFDPKNLLLFIGKENMEELIPPPPEFRDELPSNMSQNISMPVSDLCDFTQESQDSLQHYKENVLNEHNASCDEIETWVLPCEENMECYRPFNLKHDTAHIAIQYKYPEISARNEYNSPLDQFQYKHKEKMKVHKDARGDHSFMKII